MNNAAQKSDSVSTSSLCSTVFTECQALYKLFNYSMPHCSHLKYVDGNRAYLIELGRGVNTIKHDIFKYFYLIFKTFWHHVLLYLSNHIAHFSPNSGLPFQSLLTVLWWFPLMDLIQILPKLCSSVPYLFLGVNSSPASSLKSFFSKPPQLLCYHL